MDDDNKFWLCILAMIIPGIVAIAAIIAIGSNYAAQATNAKVVEMVKAGADPITAACAIESWNGGAAAIICAKATKQQ